MVWGISNGFIGQLERSGVWNDYSINHHQVATAAVWQ
jgi:hypothetical protein